jgi:hypothetical protein
MKRRITLSIALVLTTTILSLMSSDSTAQTQQSQRFKADTGIVTLGPNQVLRVWVWLGETYVIGEPGPINTYVRFGRVEYTQSVCNGGVCKHTIASQTVSNPITLTTGEAASSDIPNTTFGVRGMVLSNSRDVKVNVMIIDSATGNVVATFQALVTNEE